MWAINSNRLLESMHINQTSYLRFLPCPDKLNAKIKLSCCRVIFYSSFLRGDIVGKSQRPSAGEIVAAMRLVGECRDLAHDSDLWHRHCLEGLRRMLGAFTATGGEGTWLRPGNPVNPRQVITVGMSEAAERIFRQFVQKDHALGSDPFFHALSQRPDPFMTFRREQLVTDSEWYAAPSVMDVRKAAGSDDVLNTTFQFRADGTVNVLTLQKAWGERSFNERERRILHLFHQEIGPLIGGVLATIDNPGSRGLSRRQLQTLQRIVNGMTQKEIAGALGIQPTTARDYVDELKRHFRVGSTLQLISGYLGRNRLPLN
jgi:DNA-binding CsgD family transcriptional regulator